MELTKEMLLERKTQMTADYEHTTADMHAISGALQQIDWDLEQLEKEDAE
jgi:hypothetical protein